MRAKREVRRSVCIGLPIILVALLLLAALAGAAEKKMYNWRMACASPVADGQWRHGPFVNAIKKMSGGQINIRLHFGNELMPDTEIVDAVRDGVVEMGFTWPSYVSDRMPIGAILNGTLVSWKTVMEGDIFLRSDQILKLGREAFAKLGNYYLGPMMTTPVNIVSKKPIRNLQELRKITTRASGSTAAYLKLLKAPTVYTSTADVYDAFQKGQIEAAISGAAGTAVSRGYAGLAKNVIIDPPISNPAVACYLINLKLWNSLTEDLQQILVSATNENSQYIANEEARREIYALEKLKKEGGEFTTFPPADKAYMTKVALGEWLDQYAKKSDDAAKAAELLRSWIKALGYMN